MDWIAMCLTFANVYLMTEKRIEGWFFGMAGNVLWAAHSVYTGQLPLLLLNLAFFVLNIRGYYKWSSDASSGHTTQPASK